MRSGSSMVLVSLLLGCGRDAPPDPPDPIGEMVWMAGGGFDPCFVALYRNDERIELRACYHRAVGTLTPAGLIAWDDAVASVDPAEVSDLPICAISDGIDICFDLEGDGDLFSLCYCAIDPPPPEVAELHAYFESLGIALSECESSEHIIIDLCDPA